MLSIKEKDRIKKIERNSVRKEVLKPMWELIKKSMPDKFKIVLLNYSESEDYEEALNEWLIVSKDCYIKERHSYCICSNKISRKFYIVNEINGNVLCLGSSCISKFKKLVIEFKIPILFI